MRQSVCAKTYDVRLELQLRFTLTSRKLLHLSIIYLFFLHVPNYAQLGSVFSKMTSSKRGATGQTSIELSFDDMYQKCCSQ